ncbi:MULTISPECIES: hypothetical protein [Streptomyces]|uniref:Uncharacterized protein n=1 Tax=Streptomyces ardesiacus TaxID=285564 RepID=A0ABW8HDD9_9ACTN|nr:MULTISPECIES: hypothetical protein [Streptomyces]NEB59217.1 hypothetical protein [Streptomyces diastaticus]KOT96115.1 hypothetical protein ADK87_24125 [Streptomyces sp. NRRL F-4711]KOX29762.1 hypothetical protein ADL07_22135 [Streptomyces sp. NRRL F-4707]KOX43499.1 hypothetical protein ADL09_27675 [Streptomyces sp. NRRL F-7442]MCL7365601.1 hypothetical protein [Streptomyces ardesiacus]
MFGRLAPPDLNVLVLRDTDLAARGIRQALAEATPGERPGLERAAALVEQAAAASDAELRARWVHERLAAAGHEGPVDSVHAIKALRGTTPGLSLRQAVRLTKDAAAHRP